MPHEKAPSVIKSGAEKQLSLASKADDLEALRETLVDAASVSVGLWLSYLFVLFYFFIAAAGVTHRDLFLENPVKLPFLNVDLPLHGFFVLGPGLFLIVHAYILIHFTLLAFKVGVFHAELKRQIEDEAVRTRLRQQLPSNIFVQTLAGPYEVRSGVLGFLLRQIAWITLVGAPIALLLFFQLQFLAYHDEAITWWQRVAVALDLLLLWIFWPSIARGEARSNAWSTLRLNRAKFGGVMIASIAILIFVFTIATHPGEALHDLPSLRIVPWKSGSAVPWKLVSLHELLVAGEVDFTTRTATSFWSNRLVLPGIDVVDHSKFDGEDKIANMPSPILLRARHLEGAVLTGSTLRRVDFTSSWMQGAFLNDADLREAKFGCDDISGKASRCTQLEGASFVGSRLQASSFVEAQLEGALFYSAQLQGASLLGANLNAAAMDNARLQGATLDTADLRGASLINAQLQGAVLDSANLQLAILDSAQLQGASLSRANLDGASFRNTFVWRTDVRNALSAKGVRVNARTGAQESCSEWGSIVMSGSNCSWSQTSFAQLRQLISDQVPKGPFRNEALARIQRLDPTQYVLEEAKIEAAWAALGTSSPSVEDYGKEKADLWRRIGCNNHYVLRGLTAQVQNRVASGAGSKELSYLVDVFNTDQCKAARSLSEEELEGVASLRNHGVLPIRVPSATEQTSSQ